MFRKSMIILSALAAFLPLSACDDGGGRKPPVIQLGLRSDSTTGAHMVESGDTLWNIAKRYRVSVRDVIEKNGLTPPYNLDYGQRILLPAPAEYKVKKGDTVEAIANMFGTGVYQLARVNKLQGQLKPGQVLRIPSSHIKKAVVADVAVIDIKPAPSLSAHRPETVEAETLQPVEQSKPQVKVVTLQPVRDVDFMWPVRGKVISGYGPKAGGIYNDGINIAAVKGSPVLAAAMGEVVYTGDDLKSYGNMVLVRHGNGMTTAYAHLSSIHVKKGDFVRKGQILGAVGKTGGVTSPQLHFEIRKGSKTYDPRQYLG